MYEYERWDRILLLLREKQAASVRELSEKLYASEATIRRDLSALEQKGLIRRMRGGAALVDDATRELPLYMREMQQVEAKRIIAARAARHLQDGQIIFLDASSTVMQLIPYLEARRHLTIITNGMKTAQELSSLPHKTYCTGGLMLHNSSAYVGNYAADFVANFNADLFFFSSRGVSDSGMITDASSEETHIRQVMFAHSCKHIFLYDHTKIGKTFCYNLCSMKLCDDAVTDLI